MSPTLHAALVGSAAVAALVAAGLILARHPHSATARLHAVYGGTAAWWLLAMAMVASAESSDRAYAWSLIAYPGIAMLPGVAYHVNMANAGLARERRRAITVCYLLAALLTAFGLIYPGVLQAPRRYSWGFYPALSAWGSVLVGLLLAVFVATLRAYREVMRRHPRGSPHHERARAFHLGNHLTFLAAADYLAAFGVPVYPFGFTLICGMLVATLYGAVRYPLMEITPQIAAARILETIPDGLLVVDTRRVVRLANGPAARLLGCRLDDLQGQPLASIVNDAGLRRLFEQCPDGLAAREVRFAGADGVAHVVAVSGSLVHDPRHEARGWVWLLRDVTEQRRAEEDKARIESWLRQTQRMESLGVMAGGVAHDFNNILTVIQGNADIALLKVRDGEAVRDELEQIAAAVAHAAKLTDQLLTYAGRGTSTETLVDLNTLLRDISDLLRSALSKKARLEIHLTDPLPFVLGDQSQLRQVILNLLTNASEALGDQPGTITVRTGVTTDGNEARVFLEVCDTGAGMSPEVKARIFDPFFTTKFAGRGLGLATVMGIVQKHRGVIAVESRPGAGTRFEVVLPAGAGEVAPPSVVGPATPGWQGRGLALLVDDEAAVRRVVRQILTTAGFEVLEAVDGADGVDAFRRRASEFAIVVLDLTMPRMDGRQALAAIRGIRPAVPVVIISGYAIGEGAEPLEDAYTGVLHKPFTNAALVSRIRELTARDEPAPLA